MNHNLIHLCFCIIYNVIITIFVSFICIYILCKEIKLMYKHIKDKTTIVGTTPKRTHGRTPWPHKALIRWTRGTSHPLFGRSHGLTHGTPIPCPDPVASISNKILDRISQAIIIHFAKSIPDRTFLDLYKWPAPRCLQSEKTKVMTNHHPNNLYQPSVG